MESQDSNSTTPSSGTDYNLAIVATEGRGIQEHKFAKADPTKLKPYEIIAQVAYSGLNHVDVSQIQTGVYISQYPYILGKEWSGQILHVGSAVKDLKPGDWVLGLGYEIGGLQEQITTSRVYVCPKPEKISAEQASTIAHRYAAAIVALYMKEGLNLPLHPSESEKTEHKVIVWGASTGTGIYAIQALKAAGYRNIIAAASTKHKAKLESIGATDFYDRNDPDVVRHILSKHPDISLGLVCQADDEGWERVLDVVKPTESKNMLALVVHIIRRMPLTVPEGVTLRRVVAFVLLNDHEVGNQIIQILLSKLLALPTFQLPKEIQIFKDGTLAGRVNSAIPLLKKNGDINAVIKVSS